MTIITGEHVLTLDSKQLRALTLTLQELQRQGRLDIHLKFLLAELVVANRSLWAAHPKDHKMPDLTTREAASELGLSTRRVQQLVKSGQIPAKTLQNGTYRISYKALDQYRALGYQAA